MRRRKLIDQVRADQLHKELTSNKNPKLADVIESNIEVVDLLRRKANDARSPQDKFADAITAFSGSMVFFYLHVVWFGVWVLINLGFFAGIKAFDPFPFGLLTMVVSLEAIFLSTFVLISQNRQSVNDDHRDSLDLQIDLLAEYEITRMLRLVDKMAEKMGIEDAYDAEIDQLCEPVAPDVVLKEIERHQDKR